jgi:hypothetical protein
MCAAYRSKCGHESLAVGPVRRVHALGPPLILPWRHFVAPAQYSNRSKEGRA